LRLLKPWVYPEKYSERGKIWKYEDEYYLTSGRFGRGFPRGTSWGSAARPYGDIPTENF
jgi:hypothetical protein